MKDVVFLSVKEGVPPDSYWDMSMLKELLSSCNFHYDIGDLKEAIVIIPGSRQFDCLDKINKELSKLQKCKVIITSDEENLFPIDELSHPNMKLYSQCPTDKFNSDITWLPIGAPVSRKPSIVDKDIELFFAGQVNHKDREDCVAELKKIDYATVYPSKGFTQGMEQSAYYGMMDRVKIAACPNGVVSPDSFRLYEALESGAIPVVNESDGFWITLFGYFPFPYINDWSEIRDVEYDERVALHCMAWWKGVKRDIKNELLGTPDTTVVIPVSPIKSHPKTSILDETIASIRRQLPNSEIIVTFDGVREEQKDKTADYHKFIRTVIGKEDVYPVVFLSHAHQVGMMNMIIDSCSKYIVYVEQDTPFTEDYIDWDACRYLLAGTDIDLIRFHHEASIPTEHNYLMLDESPIEINSDVSIVRTRQWSQRPHITTKKFYKKVLTNFSHHAKSFIEDKMHSVAQEFPNEYRLAIYHPKGSIKRSYHTDGRAGEEKYEDKQIF